MECALIAFNLRPLPGIIARFCGFGRRRSYEFEADVIATWCQRDYDPGVPIFTETGPVRLTLAAHESMRAFSLPCTGWQGIYLQRGRNTWTLTLIAFCFTITLLWCWKPNLEKVDLAEMASGKI